MSNTGWLTLNTFSEVNNPDGTEPWFNEANAKYEDNTYATNSWNNYDRQTEYLQGVELLSHGIPSGSTINGVEVRIKRWRTSTAWDRVPKDSKVHLVIAGTINTTQNKASSDEWPDSNSWKDGYGGSTDKWGLSLTYSDVTNSGFGVALSFNADAGINPVAYVDCIQMKIYYDAPSSQLGSGMMQQYGP